MAYIEKLTAWFQQSNYTYRALADAPATRICIKEAQESRLLHRMDNLAYSSAPTTGVCEIVLYDGRQNGSELWKRFYFDPIHLEKEGYQCWHYMHWRNRSSIVQRYLHRIQ